MATYLIAAAGRADIDGGTFHSAESPAPVAAATLNGAAATASCRLTVRIADRLPEAAPAKPA
jgi:hypothetical protein